MKIKLSQLKRIIAEEVENAIHEDDDHPHGAAGGEEKKPSPGGEQTKGTLDISALSKKLGVDKDHLVPAIAAAKKANGVEGINNTAQLKALAGAFYRLMMAGPEETTQAMALLKKVEAKPKKV